MDCSRAIYQNNPNSERFHEFVVEAYDKFYSIPAIRGLNEYGKEGDLPGIFPRPDIIKFLNQTLKPQQLIEIVQKVQFEPEYENISQCSNPALKRGRYAYTIPMSMALRHNSFGHLVRGLVLPIQTGLRFWFDGGATATINLSTDLLMNNFVALNGVMKCHSSSWDLEIYLAVPDDLPARFTLENGILAEVVFDRPVALHEEIVTGELDHEELLHNINVETIY